MGVSVERPGGRSPGARVIAAPSAREIFAQPGGEELVRDGLTAAGGLLGCLACGHPELYSRTALPRAAGLSIVVAAAVLAPFTWYLSLVAAALADAVLYARSPAVVVCYVCQAVHRGFDGRPRHPRFDITIAERLRHGKRAVMGAPMRPGGTADAPDPEH